MGHDFTAARARLAYVPSVTCYGKPVRRQHGSDEPCLAATASPRQSLRISAAPVPHCVL